MPFVTFEKHPGERFFLPLLVRGKACHMYQTCNQLNASGEHILKSTHKGHCDLTHVCTGNYRIPNWVLSCARP